MRTPPVRVNIGETITFRVVFLLFNFVSPVLAGCDSDSMFAAVLLQGESIADLGLITAYGDDYDYNDYIDIFYDYDYDYDYILKFSVITITIMITFSNFQ